MDPRPLVLDVGGSNVKLGRSVEEKRRKVPSGKTLTPERLIQIVRENANDWGWNCISIGIPAAMRRGKVIHEPVNLGTGWVGFDFEAGFGVPVKAVNDAAMQAWGSYEGDRMLFMGLGTGLGTALIDDDHLVNLELARLPFRDGELEDYVGERGLDSLGQKKWRAAVFEAVAFLRESFVADYVVIGGGNVKKLDELPEHARRGSNQNAIRGGLRMWQRGL